jgi:hypothetical protein
MLVSMSGGGSGGFGMAGEVGDGGAEDDWKEWRVGMGDGGGFEYDGGGGGATPSLQVNPPMPSSTWMCSLANVPAAEQLCGRGGPGDVAFLLKLLPGLECSPHLAAF